MKRVLRAVYGLAIVAGLAGLVAPALRAQPVHEIIVVPIEGTVDEGMAHLVGRAVDQANAEGAAAVVLDVNTPGGLVSSAFEIRDAMFRARVPTVAYVSQRAFSAGALITLSARKIVMAPGASIGAAEPIPKTVKTVSALRSEFAATAQRNGRNRLLAEAMVDATVDAPAYKRSGAILSLTAEDARKAKIADAVAPTFDDALKAAKISGTPVHVGYTWAEQLARIATTPEISGILLSLGVIGLLIEMQTLHGIAGTIGIAALALFFAAHVYAGFSNSLVIGLAILGLILILLELHVIPGHGFSGILGLVVLLAAVVLAFGIAFFFVAVQAISIAIVLSLITFWLSTRIFPESAFFKRITLSAAQGPEYVASSDFSEFLGRTGLAASYLRPAGVANIDGKRITVLTEGDFVPAGTPVRVTRVEGARIFVKPVAPDGSASPASSS
jgi:membrane-bound serine protease (ClpP class)